ncbi:MAG: hypothetical protein H8E86_06420 [Planctomycetes bacterium]|nr:hypothetical protein [Planctomycetota bacterium]
MVSINRQTFNQAVESYSHNETTKTRQTVWAHINALPALYFVQCGRKSCPVPWITFEDEKPIAMVFTETECALNAAKSMIEDGENVRVVGLPTNAASMYMTAIAAQGVNSVCFNHGPQRFDASMDEVLTFLGTLSRF